MNISAAAQRSGVPAKTIRYYESIGLMPSTRRQANGYRDYTEADVHVLSFVKRARGLGFSVEEVGELLNLWRNKRRSSANVKAVAGRHLEVLDRKIEELETMRRTLSRLVERCHGDDRPSCPILEELEDEDYAAEPGRPQRRARPVLANGAAR